jgi:hypothetical protein
VEQVTEQNYTSGDEFVVEFHEYEFRFNALDFEQRVNAAAVKLGLVAPGELGRDELDDLVELVSSERIAQPRSPLGQHVVGRWPELAQRQNESLVYWLRKLVFRSAWLDHRVKQGLLEVVWDDPTGEFGYRDPRGGAILVDLAPVPSWHAVQYRR